MATKNRVSNVNTSLQVLRNFNDHDDRLAEQAQQLADMQSAGYLTGKQADASYSPAAVRDALQVGGKFPLSVQGLRGQLIQPQVSLVKRVTALPIAATDPLRQDGTLVLYNGALYAYDGTKNPGKWFPSAAVGILLQDTHSNRLANFSAASYQTGTGFYETDRQVLYTLRSNAWFYATGLMRSLLSNRPGDLGSNDAGFLFNASDTQTLYQWTGSAWSPVLATSGSSTTVPALITPADWATFNAASGSSGTALQKANNLSDVASAATSRTNLGLGSAATQPTSAFDASGAASAAQTAAQSFASNASNLTSGTVPAARLPNPSATTLGGVESLAATAHQFLTSISTAGVPSAAQPAAGDISGLAASATTDTTNAGNITSGTLPAARLPAPTATTLGGVQSFAAAANQFLVSISTAGVPAAAQPSFSNLSGTATAAQMAALLSTANTWSAVQTHSSPISITYAGSTSSALSITAGTGAPGAARITATADSVSALVLVGPSSNLQFNSSGGNYVLNNSAGSIQLSSATILNAGAKTNAYLAAPLVTITGATTLSTSNYGVEADATAGAFTVTLPTSPVTGMMLQIIKIDSSANIVTVSGSINGVASKQLTAQWQSLRLQFNGTAWRAF